jgi:hypothetical protein
MARAVVTVGEYPNAMLAEIARGRLEEEGIQAEVSGAMAQTWAGGDVPFLGVRLEVLREDADRALAILEAIETGEDPPEDAAAEPQLYVLEEDAAADEEEPEDELAASEVLRTDSAADEGDDEADDQADEEADEEADDEPEDEDHPDRWSRQRTRRAIRDTLIVTLLSWIWLPLVTVALALALRVLLHRGTKPWTPGMRTAFGVTAILVMALLAYSVYVVLTDPVYWFMPWPWFQGTPLPALPEE